MARHSSSLTVQRLALCVACGLLLLATGAAAAKAGARPAWTHARPPSVTDYIGIGMAVIRGNAEEARQAARQNALADIVTQISVSVVGQSQLVTREDQGGVAQQYASSLTASVSLELEGVEIVETWEGAREVWVHARLGKAEFQQAKLQQFGAARDQALALLAQAEPLAARDPVEALRLALCAVPPASRAAAQGALAGLGQEAVAPVAQVTGRVRAALSAIEVGPATEAVCGADGFARLDVAAVTGAAPQRRPVVRLPLLVWLQGQPQQAPVRARTDSSGHCRVTSLKADRSATRHLAYAAVDLAALVPGLGAADSTAVAQLAPPPVEIPVTVQKQAAFVRGIERNLDRDLEIPLVKPIVTQTLAARGYEFVDQPAGATLFVDIRSNTRRGNSVGSICFTYLDLEVRVVRSADSTQVAAVTLTGVKGAGADFEQAGIKAYAKAAPEVRAKLAQF